MNEFMMKVSQMVESVGGHILFLADIDENHISSAWYEGCVAVISYERLYFRIYTQGNLVVAYNDKKHKKVLFLKHRNIEDDNKYISTDRDISTPMGDSARILSLNRWCVSIHKASDIDSKYDKAFIFQELTTLKNVIAYIIENIDDIVTDNPQPLFHSKVEIVEELGLLAYEFYIEDWLYKHKISKAHALYNADYGTGECYKNYGDFIVSELQDDEYMSYLLGLTYDYYLFLIK